MSQRPPIPADEQERLHDLASLHLLDTPPEERFERLLHQARTLYAVPIAFISLVDVRRQWFKACLGISLSETSRDVSFCGYTILSDEPMVIPDALLDERFARNPLVLGTPFIRFYAGHPLHGPGGYRVGSLCLVDFVPRMLSAEDFRLFKNLALVVEQEVKRTVDFHQSLDR
jgi:GAF domain-containing protein